MSIIETSSTREQQSRAAIYMYSKSTSLCLSVCLPRYASTYKFTWCVTHAIICPMHGSRAAGQFLFSGVGASWAQVHEALVRLTNEASSSNSNPESPCPRPTSKPLVLSKPAHGIRLDAVSGVAAGCPNLTSTPV